mgnify:FL=1
MLPKLQIVLPNGQLSLDDLFLQKKMAFWLEIGFGGGEHLAAQAKAHPAVGFIGCEPFVNGVARLLANIEQENLSNIRLFSDDARPLMDCIEDSKISRAFVLFPDPWPKKRHAGRRFINPENLDTLSRILCDGAEVRVASDEMGYIRWTLKHFRGHPDFEWMAEGAKDWRERPKDWPPTRYESKALALGRPCIYLQFRRRERSITI